MLQTFQSCIIITHFKTIHSFERLPCWYC